MLADLLDMGLGAVIVGTAVGEKSAARGHYYAGPGNEMWRAALETVLLVNAEGFLDQLHAPFLVFNFGGRENTYEEHLLDKPPTGDIRNLMQSAGIAIDRSLKLALHDTDTSGSNAAVDQWLLFMTDGAPPTDG